MSILFDDVKATYGEKNKIMRKQIQQRRWSMTQGKIFKRHKFTKLVIWTCFKKKKWDLIQSLWTDIVSKCKMFNAKSLTVVSSKSWFSSSDMLIFSMKPKWSQLHFLWWQMASWIREYPNNYPLLFQQSLGTNSGIYRKDGKSTDVFKRQLPPNHSSPLFDLKLLPLTKPRGTISSLSSLKLVFKKTMG